MNDSKSARQENDLPAGLIDRWDNSVRTLAQLLQAETCLITEVVPKGLLIRACIDNSESPLKVNDIVAPQDSLFCLQVVKQRKRMIIVDDNAVETVDGPRILYCGEPLRKPDDQLLGTLCVLNIQGDVAAYRVESTVSRFAHLIESDLKWQSYLSPYQIRKS